VINPTHGNSTHNAVINPTHGNSTYNAVINPTHGNSTYNAVISAETRQLYERPSFLIFPF
jgi:hypothetical protein